jgi:hypothetical protein
MHSFIALSYPNFAHSIPRRPEKNLLPFSCLPRGKALPRQPGRVTDRKRSFVKSIKPDGGEQADSDLREIVFKKNQYGTLPNNIVLRYQNGLFLPVPGVASLDRIAQEARAKDVFLALLDRFTSANRNVSDKTGTSYAPALFAKEDEAKKALLNSKQLAVAMRDLFREGKIWNEPCGRPSRPAYRIARKQSV